MTFDSSSVSSLVEWMSAILSPVLHSLIYLASSIIYCSTLSSPSSYGSLYPVTPLDIQHYVTVNELIEAAKIVRWGRYFATSLASLPVSVKITINFSWAYSWTAKLTAAATDSAPPAGDGE